MYQIKELIAMKDKSKDHRITNLIQELNILISTHSSLRESGICKIKRCIEIARSNPWITSNQFRTECITCSIESINWTIVQPTLQLLNDTPDAYQCILTDELPTWNMDTNTSNCVRMQFLFPPQCKQRTSIYWTVQSPIMSQFLCILSTLSHIEESMNQYILQTYPFQSQHLVNEIPPALLHDRVLFDAVCKCVEYVYIVVDKQLQPPTIPEVRQTLL